MSVAPHSGIVDFGTFTPPDAPLNGIQGEVPAPLLVEEGYFLSTSGWVPGGSGSGTVTSVAATAGTGISVTGSPITTSGTLNITNTAPDQVVALTGAGTTTVTGTYPNFIITSADSKVGDVVGPASATDNAVARFDTTTGKLIQNSVTLIDDTGNASGILSQQFSNGSAVTLAAGKMWYDGTTGAWNAGMGGGNITQQIGEELFVYGKASATITDSPLQIVYHTGTVGASGVITFAPTIAGITDENAIIGVATESLALNDFGRVTSFGVVRGITTNGTAFGETWADDDVIWYNPVTGNPTKVKPSAPYIKFQIGTVIKAGSGGSGSFQVNLVQGTALGGTDSNVQITSPSNGNILTYDGGNGYWKNTDLTAGTGISISETVNGVLTVTNTSPSSGGTVTSVSGTAPVVSSGGNTPAISMPAATTLIDGYLSAIDWNTFNNKQPAGAYLTTVTSDAPLTGSGTSASHLSIPAATTSVDGYLTSTDWTTFNNKGNGTVTSVSGTAGRITSTGGATPVIDLASGVATAGTTGSSSLIPVVTIDTYGRVTGITTAANPQGTVTSVSGTGTVSGISLSGTVTSSGNLTLGGTLDLSSPPAIGGTAANLITGTTITATTFSGSGANLTSIPNSALVNSAITINGTSTSLGGSISVGTVTNVTGTSPVVSSGGATPDISMPAATTSVNGYLTSTDWTTFNNKGNGTVTSVAALTLGTTGTDLSSTVATGTTTPVITLQVPTASAANRGALSAADWTTFNNKGSGTVTSVAATVPSLLSVSGSPITTSGTLAFTYSGTALPVVNGGTGQTTYTNGQLLIGNTTGNTLTKATLTAGAGVAITNSTGSITVAGALAESTSVFVTGTAQTYTAPANTQWVKVTVVGPGGNGGATNNQRATGGSGGAVSIKGLIMNAGHTLTYTVGTASGTASTVSSGTLTITTISGGSGTNGAGTAYAASLTAGPAGGTATGGDVNITGGKGGNSYGSGTTVTTNFSGAGGSCQFGQGGPALALVATAGQVGTGFGAGGGGGHGNNTAVAGTGGIIIFEAY